MLDWAARLFTRKSPMKPTNATASDANVLGVTTSNHNEWLKKGGVRPDAPAVGMKAKVAIIDYQQPSRDALRDQIARALKEDGFFVLTNHTVPPTEVDSMLSWAKAFFFRLRDDAAGRRNKVAEKIRMNEMLRPMTKAARGFSFYEEETLNGFMGADQKFTFDYALHNDAAFIGRRTAFEKEAAALERQPENASAQALKERYQRIRTCEEHLGKNLWPEEETADEEKAAIEAAAAAAAAARELAATNVAPRPQPNFRFGGGKSEEELERDLGTFSAQVAAEPLERKAPRGFRDACEHYLADLFPLSQDLLALILEGAAGLDAETIATKVKPLFDDPLVIHRLISYPPQRTRQELTNESRTMELYRAVGERTGGMSNQQRDALVQEELQKRVNAKISMSCGAHVDYGALTMIAEDKGKALEIERRGHPGQYEYLPEIPKGAFIVSTGFMLEKLTNGKIPATRHRVQNVTRDEDCPKERRESCGFLSEQVKAPTIRTAMAFFLDPHPEAFIEPLPECIDTAHGEKPLYEGCVAGAKGVRFGDPRYLEQIATNIDKMRRDGVGAFPDRNATSAH